MNEEKPNHLSEAVYLSEVVPFFEEAKSKLLSCLKGDAKWASFFANLHIVYIDNSRIEKDSHFYLSKCIAKNMFLINSEPVNSYYGSRSEEYSYAFIHLTVLQYLRYAFIEELLTFATPMQISDYIQQLLMLNYRAIRKIIEPNFICLQVSHFKFSESFFSINASELNIVISLDSELDANQLRSGNRFICRSPDSINILLSTERNVESYKGFNQTLNIEHLTNHFYRQGFILGISLFRQILKVNYDRIFKITEILKTTINNEIYEMKKQLVRLEVSKGKLFEAYITRFLEICFQSHFQDLTIRKQVSNHGRIRIRDFVIVNTDSSSDFLRFLKKKGVECLLFDAKNYGARLNPADLDTFQMYLEENLSFGNLGIILSRNGVSRNCQETIFRSLYREKRKIIVLTQEDLLLMLDYIDSGKDALNVIKDKYYELVLKM